MASVSWSTAARADLGALDPVIAKRVVDKVQWLGENFDVIVPEPLHADFAGLYKVRTGDYRTIYAVRAGVIYIEAVRHRRDAYRS